MLATAHQELAAWLAGVADESPGNLQLVEGTQSGDEVVRLRLGHVLKDDPTEGGRRPDTTPLVIRYVVSLQASPLAALSFLERFVSGLRGRTRTNLRLDIDPFDVVPRLDPGEVGVVIDVAAAVAADILDAPLVTRPMVLDTGGLRRFGGVVHGHGLPLAGAQVVLSSVTSAVRTNAKGEFSFSAVPAHPPVQKLSVQVKGRTFHADADVTAAEPVVINCDL